MRKWYWILAGLLALDLLVFLLAWPILTVLEGAHSELSWGVWATRTACGVIAGILIVALIVVWNIDYHFFRRT